MPAYSVYHINPLHPNISMHILHTDLRTFPKDKENLSANQKVPSLVTINFILKTFICDSGLIL